MIVRARSSAAWSRRSSWIMSSSIYLPAADLGRRHRRLHGRRAAELLVVDQAGDRRVVAAQRALGVPAQVHLPEVHVEALEDQQLADQAPADAQHVLDRLE